MVRTMSWNCSLRATKSVSELTSTMAPAWSLAATPMSPSAATRPALLAAFDSPFLRSQSMAPSMSPLTSVSAILQSIMPAPVLSRSSFTRLAVIVVMDRSFGLIAGLRREDEGQDGRSHPHGPAPALPPPNPTGQLWPTLAHPGPLSSRLPLCQLLGGGNPVVAGNASSKVERAVEGLQGLRIEIGDLPEVIDADVVEPLLEFDVHPRQTLEVVCLAARGVDALEHRLVRRWQLLGRGLLRRADVDASLRLATLDAVDGCARHQVAVKRDGASRIVVAWDHEVDAVGVAIGVHHGDNGDAQLLGFGNGNLLLVGVDDEEQIRQAAHLLDAAQRFVEAVTVARKLQHLLLGAASGIAAQKVVQLLEPADRLRDGLPVGERAAEPAVVDEILRRALGGIGDALRGLPLGAHKEYPAAAGDDVTHLDQCLMQHRHGLGQVDNVDVVAGAEDVGSHLRIPAMALVAEVAASLEQLTHVEGG